MSRYKAVNVFGRTVPEHRLVWIKAHGPIPPGYEIHHRDGNPRNNKLENLIMLTKSAHKKEHLRLRAEGKDVVDATDPVVIQERERAKKWVKEHPEQFRKIQAKYRKAHPEVRRAYERANSEKINARSRELRKINIEHQLAYERDYRATHKEAIKANSDRYNDSHRELINTRSRYKYALKRGFPQEDIDRLKAAYEAERERCRLRRKQR